MSDRPPKKRKKGRLKATISIQGVPEMEAALRGLLADLLREFAMDEAPAVAARLNEIAALFETGLQK